MAEGKARFRWEGTLWGAEQRCELAGVLGPCQDLAWVGQRPGDQKDSLENEAGPEERSTFPVWGCAFSL